MESSAQLASFGHQVTLLEKEKVVGGHVANWERLFPTMKPASEIIDLLKTDIMNNVNVQLDAEVFKIEFSNQEFIVTLTDGQILKSDAVLLATGYDLFDPRGKEEYGYGIYDNVITSAELEAVFKNGKELKTSTGKTPKRVGIIHCVGSRDIKAGNQYCSNVCCITGVKQAIEIKEAVPDAEVFCFYMDLRMFGRYFEDMYLKAQEKYGVQFVRGRLSEACENQDGSLIIKVEDTLASKPLKMTVDLIVLLLGFEASKGTTSLGKMLHLNFGDDRFISPTNEHLLRHNTKMEGIFVAGTCTGPKSIIATISDARGAVITVNNYLNNLN